MPVATVISKNGVPVRLTEERWAHIVEEHGELAEMQSLVLSTVADPVAIYAVMPESYWPLERWSRASG